MPFSEFILRDSVKKTQKKCSERLCEGRAAQGFTQSLEVCHCEERSDVAINNERGLCQVDCFAALAMTKGGHAVVRAALNDEVRTRNVCDLSQWPPALNDCHRSPCR